MRTDSTVPNRFDDEIHVFYKTQNSKWNYHLYKATTDPGTFWLLNPMQEQGTAILAEGQYLNSHSLGLHKGQYEALVQTKPLTVIRDYERIAKLDFMNGKKDTGYFGIDIHRASATGNTKYVDKYSAGCQVFENADAFHEFISFCERHEKLYGNHFTYTLIDFRMVKRITYRRIAISTGIVTLVALGVALAGTEKIKTIAEEIGETFTTLFKQRQTNGN
jgi:hypothetical protein